MNCLKTVILLWTGIIAFNASVTAYEIDGKDIRELRVNYCGGVLKSMEVYFVYKQTGGPMNDVFNFFQIPGDHGPLRRIVIPYNESPCREEKQNIALPIKLLESTFKQLQFNRSQKEISRK